MKKLFIAILFMAISSVSFADTTENTSESNNVKTATSEQQYYDSAICLSVNSNGNTSEFQGHIYKKYNSYYADSEGRLPLRRNPYNSYKGINVAPRYLFVRF